MNARLLVVDPQEASRPPFIPNLVLDNQGTILVCGEHWALPICSQHLEQVTVNEVRQALRPHPPETTFMYLSPMRSLPDEDIMSPSMLTWLQNWWIEVVTELSRDGRITDAPSVKAMV